MQTVIEIGVLAVLLISWTEASVVTLVGSAIVLLFAVSAGQLAPRHFLEGSWRSQLKWQGGGAGRRGKRLQCERGEKIERNFAHQFHTGGMDQSYLRGRENVRKRLLIQAAAYNLALLLRSLHGAGKPRFWLDALIVQWLAEYIRAPRQRKRPDSRKSRALN